MRLTKASSIIGDDGDGDGDEVASTSSASKGLGGLADFAEDIVDAVENATSEIFNATAVSTFLISEHIVY